MNKFRSLLISAVVGISVLAGTASAQTHTALSVAPVFGDHMVLQQEKPVTVWGLAVPGSPVSVQFDGQTVKTTADNTGKWKLQLAPMKATSSTEQKPQVMTITDGKATLEINDVLIGEVWLGSGQSNMEFTTKKIDGDYPAIRLLTKTGWQPSIAKDFKTFSNLMWNFGRNLQKNLNVPVGLLVGAAGGTDSGRWLALGAGADPELLRVAAIYEKRYPEFKKQYEDDVAELAKEDTDWEARLLPYLLKHWACMTELGAKKGEKNPHTEKFVAGGGDLNKIQKLSELNQEQLKCLNGSLSRLINSNGPEVNEGLALVDDFVRATHPERLDLKPCWLSWHYGWGIRHPIPLQAAKPGVPKKPDAQAGNLFTNHIAPLVPFAIRGILWDQGESGTGIPGVDQFTLMSALIKSWRAQWNEELPWIYVQKPSGEGCRLAYEKKDESVPFQAKLPEFIPDPNWGLYREIHIRIGTLPKTSMVASSDLNPGVHPHDKDRYGGRAADVALNTVYGKPVQCFGPRYQSRQVAGNKLRLTFSQTGKGLVAAHADNPQGFEIAGADKQFVWAEARIIAPDTVELWSDQVKKPVAARYAYGCRIPWANLFNQDGLPAATFRTDDWTWEGQNPIFVWKMYYTESRRENWVWEPSSEHFQKD
ncbi:MAG: hypothetical protein NTY53_25420 [Kiritimatiellaeota bacterium]|nr:hypothetical protein [Kiritimatiellota bacterium]